MKVINNNSIQNLLGLNTFVTKSAQGKNYIVLDCGFVIAWGTNQVKDGTKVLFNNSLTKEIQFTETPTIILTPINAFRSDNKEPIICQLSNTTITDFTVSTRGSYNYEELKNIIFSINWVAFGKGSNR